MDTKSATILIADDDDSLRRVLEFQLQEAGYTVLTAENGSNAFEIFSNADIDCLITDWRMPQMSGLELLRRTNALNSEIPVVVITAFGDVETAVEAMRSGAFDFITKPFNRESILLTVEKALKFGNVMAENRRLRRVVHESFQLGNIIGTSTAMRNVFQAVERVAKTDATVLIEGESGTGKELVAKGIHFSGGRRDKPFLAINCAAIPETLIEAELFGYKKGAFTGASSESKGKFEEASGGTLFLDEISAMPLAAQPRLLRVLQEQEITRLGESTPRKVDVRIIAATNENLRERVRKNEFREDLYYRLAVVPIRMPELRERREDIPLLVEHFLKKTAERHKTSVPRIEPEAFRTLVDHDWPGNVRELENTIERMVILSGADTLTIADIPVSIQNKSIPAPGNQWFSLPNEPIELELMERDLISEALARFGGNQSQTARFLGITRSALIYRMQKHGLE
ncbi:MAG: sigma-54 dependent transcriptional regulator [Pyrinomonadaceae bacterium]